MFHVDVTLEDHRIIADRVDNGPEGRGEWAAVIYDGHSGASSDILTMTDREIGCTLFLAVSGEDDNLDPDYYESMHGEVKHIFEKLPRYLRFIP